MTTHLPLVAGAAITTLRREAAVYKPFGEMTEVLQPTQVNPEQKGWIGQRYDADAGPQYLNARYYDPEYGFFLQPDWFEVTAAGVGTNRYSYSFNDPVNMRDPGGDDSFGSGNPTSGYDTDGDGLSRHVGGWNYDSRVGTGVGWRDPTSDPEGKGGPTGSDGYGLTTEGTICFIPDDHIDPRRSSFFMARSVLSDIRDGVQRDADPSS